MAPRVPARADSDTTAPLAQLAQMAQADGTPLPTARASRGAALKAVRVAVERGDDDEELAVLVLEEDAPLPSGWYDAVLVTTETALDQLTRRR